VAEPVKVENPSEGQRFFSTTNRSPSRRTAEFCGFVAAEAVEVRKLDQTKTAQASEQARPDVARRRQAWFDGQPDLDPERLMFVDASAATTKMARLRGRAPRGERCRAAVPHGPWKTTTFTNPLKH